MSTKVEIIIGCMFSGKTTELIRRISRYEAIKMKTLIINSNLDTRTGDSVKTHDNHLRDAIKTSKLMDITDSDSYKNAVVIGIDESQFFPDLEEFVIYSEKNKTIIIAGLDGDSNRKPFGQILQCIPLCDSIIKLTAMDMISKDGQDAIFTKRIVLNDSQQISIGAMDKYIAVSRANYLK
uniref:thymidine kinase n=1 Tax=viral metagenome TaxID=1070528 RepID=A0A6C0ELD8_9ZZZZ